MEAGQREGRIKGRQHLAMAGIAAVLGLGVSVTVYAFLWEGKPATAKARSYKAPITGGGERVDPKEVWMEQFQSAHNIMLKRMEILESALNNLVKMNTPSPSAPLLGQEGPGLPSSPGPFLEGNTPEAKTALDSVAGEARSAMASALGPQSPGAVGGGENKGPTGTGMVSVSKSQAPRKRPHTASIHHVALRGGTSKSLKTTDNTIPAGAFAQAILLGVVDASASIQASSDPRPILLRITDPGTLPRKFKSDLCGCHALAASYGDISSERVFMRLEKVTCTERKTGEIVEMNVQGYVAGEDGRAGLRGTMVDRAGESMRLAAMGGFLSGMGNFLSQSSNNPVTYSLQSGLAQSNPLTNGDILKHGAAKGATNALEKYADFYIKRAEQMQPVIQVEAGRLVDIVFTQGTPFDDSAARSALIKVNDSQRLATVHNAVDTQPVNAWQPPASQQGDKE